MEETRRRLQRAKWIIDVCDCRTNALVDGNKRAHSVTFKVDDDDDPARKAVREAREEVREIIRKAESRLRTANILYVDRAREERDRKSFEPSRRPRRRRRRGVRANWNFGSDQPRSNLSGRNDAMKTLDWEENWGDHEAKLANGTRYSVFDLARTGYGPGWAARYWTRHGNWKPIGREPTMDAAKACCEQHHEKKRP